jgi:hypothetical protein
MTAATSAAEQRQEQSKGRDHFDGFEDKNSELAQDVLELGPATVPTKALLEVWWTREPSM